METPVAIPTPGDAAPSRSAIARRTVTEHHVFDIEAYSQSKEELLTGEYMLIKLPLGVGGCSWRIHYYPNGRNYKYRKYISIFLGIESAEVGSPVAALARFSLLDQAGNPVKSHVRATRILHFTSRSSFGYRKFIRSEWLQSSEYLKDDKLTISVMSL